MRFMVLLFVMGLTAGLPVLAQERGKNFFEKDFVNKQMKEPDLDKTACCPPPPTSAPVTTATSAAKKGDGFVSLEPTATPVVPTPTIAPLDRFTPRKALSLSAILSAEDPSLLSQQLGSLSKLATEKKLVVRTVYIVGDPSKIPVALENLTQQDPTLRSVIELGELEPASSPPEKYKVTKTPTWIVETEEGEVLLEGAPQLERYFNFSGQFLEPLE